MIDLTTKPTQEIEILLKKYESIIPDLNLNNIFDVQIFILIIDIAIQYLNEKHNDISLDWKCYSIIYLKYEFLNKKIKFDDDIYYSIDNFIKNYNDNYGKYLNDIEINVDDYVRDIVFIKNLCYIK